MIILFKYCDDEENCESFRGFGFKKKMIIMRLSLSWTYQRNKVLLLVKFGLKNNNFI